MYTVMIYKCEDCGKDELIINSRIGVTPFAVNCTLCDGTMYHVHWDKDCETESIEIDDDDRVFVGMTIDVFKKIVVERVNIFWYSAIYQMSNDYKTKKEAIESLMKEYDPETPNIISGKEYKENYVDKIL